MTIYFAIFVLIGTGEPLNTKMTVPAKLNYQPLCYRGHPDRLYIVNQEMMRSNRLGYNKVCEAFSIFLLLSCFNALLRD